uniref:V-SNARE coiled-coil homology domain-containing protein n=1 Tax=Rhizochromulina marina TaxID=1034831 RepID=A0A7S2WFM1_9STRA|mmetsp:Transcript_23162/g.67539  ORF Transcript_23162/g.67539 Transcript_23162/m.67539 type:complete len:217 (+) Transcript_23162:225-875(+)
MTLVYALCARAKTVLAEFTATSGNFPTVTRVLLSKIPPQDGKMSYVYDRYVFHYIVEGGITYLCMTTDTGKRRIPFAFLEDVKRRFQAQFGDAIHTAIPFAMNEAFSPVLKRQMNYYNSDPGADNITQMKTQLGDVKHVMVESIEKVLERGEKIELLVDKTDRLNETAFRFEKSSKQLKEVMFWKRVRMYGIAAGVVSFVVLVIAMSACGVTFKQC